MNNPDISIIIPCYNSGKYLLEAIQSVEYYQGQNKYEIVVIDDGSTDIQTMSILNELDQKKCIVLHQENKGPGAARNAGCRRASACFLLFLDSDNKIYSTYIDAGISYLKNNSDVGVVHGKPTFFGDTSRNGFKTGPFEIDKVLAINYIDMCAVVRKSAWESIEGFDESRELIGREDWEFWIRIYRKGWKFFFLDEVMFFYRIRNNSLMSTHEINQNNNLYVYRKHYDLLSDQYINTCFKIMELKKDLRWSIRYHLKNAVTTLRYISSIITLYILNIKF